MPSPTYRLRSILIAVLALHRYFPIVTPLEVEVDEQGNTVVDADAKSEHVECGIWLAPSTLKGAGLGIYAGTDFKEDQEFLPGGGLSIALTDMAQHNAHKQQRYANQHFLLDEYTWAGSSLIDNQGVAQVYFTSEGIGAVANCFLPLFNINIWYPRQVSTGLHRSTDAGAGASTPFHLRKATARHDIEAGSELFLSCTFVVGHFQASLHEVNSTCASPLLFTHRR
jgi:hypothetical protein